MVSFVVVSFVGLVGVSVVGVGVVSVVEQLFFSECIFSSFKKTVDDIRGITQSWVS